MPDIQIFKTNEDTISVIAARAREQGDAFRVRVLRKASPAALPDTVAVLDNATVEQLATPEVWLPRLGGGGPIYQLEVFAPDDLAHKIGGTLQYRVDQEQPHPVNPEVVNDEHWKGPKKIFFPEPGRVPPSNGTPAFGIPSPSPGRPLGASAANSGSGAVYSGDGFHPPTDRVPQSEGDYWLQRERRELEERRRKEDQDAAERKHQLDLEAIQRRHDAELEKIRLEMRLMSQTVQAPPRNDLATTIGALAPLIAPVLAKIFDGQAQSALMMQEILKSSMAPRPAIDPAIKEMMSELRAAFASQTPAAAQGQQMLVAATESMSHMMGITMKAVTAAADAAGGKDVAPNPMVQVLKEGVKAIGSFMEGYKVSVQAKGNGGGAPAQALPPPQQFPQIAQGPVQPGQPAPVIPLRQPAPPQQPPPQQAQPGQPQQTWSGDPVFRMETLIKNHDPNPRAVAEFFIDSLESPQMQKALNEVDGSISELVSRRLGGWALSDQKNADYLSVLLKEVYAVGEARGVLGPDEPGEDDEEDDDEGDEEEEAVQA